MKRKPARIGLMFNHPFFLGGGERSLFVLIEGLKHSDFEPVGIVPEEGEVIECLRTHGVPATICPLRSLRRGTRRYFLGDLKTLAKAARDYGLRIIHANGSRACLYGGIVGRSIGIPVVWHVRETMRDPILYDGLLGVLATRIVCASRAVAQARFERLAILFRRKITVVHNGIVPEGLQKDEQRRDVVRQKFGLQEKDVLIGMIGNFIPLKGHEFLIKGLAEACKRNPDNRLKLLCAGRILDPDYHARILKRVKEQPLADRVILMGYTDDVAGILSAADIFALPSEREGFSRSLLEAMGMGLPVIATNLTAIAEAVEAQRGGLLVADGHVAAMADAMLTLSGRADLRNSMGRRNRERVQKCFTADLHRKAIEDLYSTLLTREDPCINKPTF
jgi:glycosyltransferase involved in cell wall biosynthesis